MQSDESAEMTVVKNQEPVINVVIVEAEPELTLEQKIQKVEDLSMLIDKFRKLRESKRNLETFKLSSDGFSNQVMLRDVNTGHEFKTYHSVVIGRVLDVIKSSLDEKIAEIEEKIRF